MKYILLLIFALPALATTETPSGLSLEEVGEYKNLLDLDVDFGLPIKNASKQIQIQARAGILFVRGGYLRSLGVRVKFSGPLGAGVLLEAEQAHAASGLWAQAGLGATTRGNGLLGGAVGWSVIGFELNRELGSSPQWALLGKVRIPLSVISMAF